MRHLAASIVARRRPMSLYACLCWLPVWLPDPSVRRSSGYTFLASALQCLQVRRSPLVLRLRRSPVTIGLMCLVNPHADFTRSGWTSTARPACTLGRPRHLYSALFRIACRMRAAQSRLQGRSSSCAVQPSVASRSMLNSSTAVSSQARRLATRRCMGPARRTLKVSRRVPAAPRGSAGPS